MGNEEEEGDQCIGNGHRQQLPLSDASAPGMWRMGNFQQDRQIYVL